MYHRLAAGALGAGYSGRSGPGRHQAVRLQAGPVEADAHRRPARAPLSHPPLEGVFPPPQVRHQLRPVRVHRPGLRPPGHGEHPQGRCHRHPRLPLGGQGRGRAGQRRAPGRGRRAVREGSRRHDLLLQQPRSHRRGLEERLALHRRHGHAGRRRLLLPGGPEEGRGRLRRREHLPRPDRGLPAHQRQDQGRGRHRPARQASGRNLRRSHRAQARCRLRRGGDQ